MFWVIVVLFILIAGGWYCFKHRNSSVEAENYVIPVNQDNQPMPKPRVPLPWKYGNVLVVGIGSAAREIISYLIYDDSTQYPLLFIGNSEEEIEGVPFCNVSLLSDDIQREGMIPSRYETNIREILIAIFVSDNRIDRVLIVSGFGGQTGTSLSPIVANVTRELGKFCYVLTQRLLSLRGRLFKIELLKESRTCIRMSQAFIALILQA